MRYLCCDLGGTTADWGIYDSDELDFVFRSELGTSDYEDFYEMMDHFLLAYKQRMGSDAQTLVNATFGVAGPTDHKRVNPTNIEGWEIKIETANAILEDHGHQGYSSIINDFEALGYGLLKLLDGGIEKNDFEPIHGRLRTGPARVGEDVGSRSIVCGPGTGLGITCLVDDLKKDGFPFIFSSEGGHQSLAPETIQQYRLLGESGAFSGKRSYESVLSHVGLRSIYNFFRKADHNSEPNWSISSDEIVQLARSGNDQAAIDAMEMFCETLANFCGNAALTFNCDKAVFLWGGAVRKMPSDLLKTRFKRHYADRSSHSERVAKTPVVLLTNKDLPLLGCAHRSDYEMKYLVLGN